MTEEKPKKARPLPPDPIDTRNERFPELDSVPESIPDTPKTPTTIATPPTYRKQEGEQESRHRRKIYQWDDPLFKPKKED